MGGSPQFDIRLLGEPVVTVAGSPIDVDTRKAIAILAYLAVEGPTSRDHLLAMLWPEASSDRARATLRRTLSSLRSGIGKEHLDSDRDRVALTGDIDVDTATFDAEIASTHQHGHDPADVCPECITHLDRATGLYRGDFLQGFAVRDAPEFEDWVRTVGEALRLRLGEALHRLAMARAAVGDYPRALAAVGRWIEIDSLHEPARRLLMLLHAWAGDRPAAMEAYRAFVAILDRELGVSPLEETSELYEAILDEDLPPPPGPRRRTRAHPPRGRPATTGLLDREDELARLRLALDSVEQRGTVVALTGEPWMGKTRLLEELGAIAQARGETVVMGRASRMEQALPYGVMSQIIEPALSVLEGREIELPSWVTIELARLIPRLAPGSRPAGPDRLGDLRFLEAVHELIRLVSSVGPMMLAVDDSQWLDTASARLVAFLTRRVSALPVLVLLAIRTGEKTDPIVTEISAHADLTVSLAPLDTRQLEGRVDAERAGAIIEASGGIPLLVLASLDSETDEVEGPEILHYIETRLRGLSDLARQVLAAASVLSGIRDIPILRETSGRTEEELVEAVEELISAGLLREIPAGGTFGFTLDAVERISYESTSLIRRRLLHERAAHALEALPRAYDDAPLAAAVAAHHHGAGSPHAAEWYRRAGDLARNVYANDEAKTMYETALALGGEDPGELHLALGELAIARGDYQAAMSELRSAASQTKGAVLSRVEHRIGEVHRLLGRFDLAVEAFARAEVEHEAAAALYADWALLHHRTGSPEALEMAEKALAAAARSGDRKVMSRAHDILGVVEPDPTRAMAHLDMALELAGEAEPERMAALNNKARLLAEIGNLDAATRLVEEALALATSTGHRHREAALRNHLADLHHQAGREDRSREALTEAVAIFSEIDAGGWEPELWLLIHW
ncbi:MAG TPA: AAA family ATPase [Acidimicrobiia bacterium]|nr:AAA family ATPase [Acidimicrobiia bacterium]